MAKSRLTVEQIAREVGMDADLALVSVWDAGIEDIEDADQPIPDRMRRHVERTLGYANPREMSRVQFWQDEWGLSREETVARLRDEFGVTVAANAKTLPSGALKRVKRGARIIPKPRIETTAQPQARVDAFELNCPGKHRDAHPLTYEDVEEVHRALVDAFCQSGDPIDPPGIRDPNLLHSAVSRPLTALGDASKYNTVEAHAAALLHSLVNNHPFFNGNKRTGLVAMLVLLDRNDIWLTCTHQALFKHVLKVAQHGLVPKGSSNLADREVQVIAEWICENSRPVHRGDRNLTWRELRKILEGYGCEISKPLPGNRVRVTRVIKEKTILGLRTKKRTIVHKTGYRSEGSEIGKQQLAHLRNELKFSQDHGYDADYFYGSSKREPDDFIAEYSRILRKLGRL